LDDRFFRQMVFNLRNGVLAITRDGRIAAMNEIAYRVLGMRPRSGDVGRAFTAVLRDCPELARVLTSAFDSDDLPNRAEMAAQNGTRDRLHPVAHPRRRRTAGRRHALLQGSDTG
jgi:PAS domain-containing protein